MGRHGLAVVSPAGEGDGHVYSGDGRTQITIVRTLVVKAQAMEAHRPGKPPKLACVEMNGLEVVDRGCAAIAACGGTYAAADASFTPGS